MVVGTVTPPYTGISGVNALLTVNGLVYAYAKTYSFKTGFKLDQEPVIGTNTPIINTGVFQGTFSMEVIWSTETTSGATGTAQLDSVLALTNGAVTPLNVILAGADPQVAVSGTGGTHNRVKTWTAQLWAESVEYTGSGTDWTSAKITGVFNGLATAT